jgi:CheY-like chemotaxis protein
MAEPVRQTILIVDDDIENLKTLSEMLLPDYGIRIANTK